MEWTGKEFIMLAVGWAVGWVLPTPPYIYRWWLGAGERERTMTYIISVNAEHRRMQALTSQTHGPSDNTSAECGDMLRALLEEQCKLLSSHLLKVLEGYDYRAKWGYSRNWLDLTWRLYHSRSFKRMVRQLTVLQFLITIATQSHDAARALLAAHRPLLAPEDVQRILAACHLSKASSFPCQSSRALVHAILNAVDAILSPQKQRPQYTATAQLQGTRLHDCIKGLGNVHGGGVCRPRTACSSNEAHTSVAVRLWLRSDSAAPDCVCKQLVGAQKMLETATQTEVATKHLQAVFPAVQQQHQQQQYNSNLHPDGCPPCAGTWNAYSLEVATPFAVGPVATPFTQREPVMVFNNALLGLDSSHGDALPEVEGEKLSSSVLLAAPLDARLSASRMGTGHLDADMVVVVSELAFMHAATGLYCE